MSFEKFSGLICPMSCCARALCLNGMQLSCEQGHSFDIAKQGYVNLLLVQQKKSLSPGDSKAMVVARNRFLNSDVYLPVLEKLTQVLGTLDLPKRAKILDAGCGEGYYTQRLAQHFPQQQFVGIDISKEALKVASRQNSSRELSRLGSEGIDSGMAWNIDWDIDWIVASNSQLPLAANSIDVIVCIFGFPSFAGFNKVLKPGGLIVLIDPAENHLIELRQELYEEVKKREVYTVLDNEEGDFELVDEQELGYLTPKLENTQLQDLLMMTPHLFRASAQGKERMKAIEDLSVTIDMLVRIFRKTESKS